MGLRSLFKKRPATAGDELPAAPRPEPEPLSPQQMAELQEAWTELNQAKKDMGVTRLLACTRGGPSWEENPETVRSLAAFLRQISAEEAAGK